MFVFRLAAQAIAFSAFVYVFMLMAFWPEPLRLALAAAKAMVS